MDMQSCFQDTQPGLWEKYLDDLHPLIRQLKDKSGEVRDDGDKENPEEKEMEVCIVLDAEVYERNFNQSLLDEATDPYLLDQATGPVSSTTNDEGDLSCSCDSSSCPSSGWSERPQ
jgi:hypothetical protein